MFGVKVVVFDFLEKVSWYFEEVVNRVILRD